MTAGPDQPFSLVPKALRKQVEATFGKRVQTWIARAGASVTDVAKLAGTRREEFYEVFEGKLHMRAAWLELLPPAVEQLFLAERAAHHGLELRPVTAAAETVHLHQMIGELTDVLRVAADAEADGHITVEEAQAELAAWEDVERIGAVRRNQLRRVVAERGAVVPLRRPAR